MPKKEIIDRIIGDANNKAEQIVAEANKIASQKVSEARVSADKSLSDALSTLPDKEKQAIERRRQVGLLEVKKDALAVKKSVLDETFALALKKLNDLKKTEYLKIISAMIAKFAEDGDEVIICDKDKDIITSKVVEDMAKKAKIKISLSKKKGKFSGGIILSNKNFDKNLTFESELSVLRAELEPEIASMLFAEV